MYQKCVCFIFLVILAILSCSGFRIDSLAMTDLTKKNFHTSPNTYSNSDKYFRTDTVSRPHKIRHHRLWRTQAHNRYPKPPHIDAIVYPPPPQPSSTSVSSTDFSSRTQPSSSERRPANKKLIWPYKSSLESSESLWLPSEYIRPPTNLWPFIRTIKPTSSEVIPPISPTSSEVMNPAKFNEANASLTSPTVFPNENLAQIPPTDFAPVKFVVSRSQRSPRHHSVGKRNKWSPHPNEDIFTLAYKAKYVVIAEVESKPGYINESNDFCQCYVKVIRDFKGNANQSFGLVNKMYRKMLTAKCDLVKKMENSKKYMLLLNEHLQLLDTPKPKDKLKSSMTKRLKRVCKPGFVPTKPHIVELKEVSPKSRRKVERKNRILICSVKGLPPPKITWRRRNEVLHQSRSYNVLYKRRQSKLVIKKPDAEYLGQYECVAESLNGTTASKNFTLLPPQPSKECPDEFKEVFCQNGGTCFFEVTMGIFACICPENYSGEKCDMKKPSNTSMYPQPDLYSCKLGLSTKYNCKQN